MRSERISYAALASIAMLMAACKGSDYWLDKLQADPLYRRAEEVRQSESCAKLVAMEFGQTFPVPLSDGAQRFKVLFYPLVLSPGKTEALTPVVEGSFERGASGQDRCASVGAGAPQLAGAPVPAGLSMTAYYRAEVRLFSSLDRVAAAYFKGGTPTAPGKLAAADFAEAFLTLAEPGLLPYYYRLNPDFWEWLRRQAGRSIAKPSEG